MKARRAALLLLSVLLLQQLADCFTPTLTENFGGLSSRAHLLRARITPVPGARACHIISANIAHGHDLHSHDNEVARCDQHRIPVVVVCMLICFRCLKACEWPASFCAHCVLLLLLVCSVG